MGIRYGRRAADGTTEYHDSKESLNEAERSEYRSMREGLFGLIGLLVGGLLAYVIFLRFGEVTLPRWARFAGVIVGAGAGAYILAKLADLIWTLILFGIAAAIIYGIGAALWRLV